MSTFVKTDLDILLERHDVRAFHFPSVEYGGSRFMWRLRALLQEVQWADLTFSWFGKLHAFFAVLFSQMLGKKSVVVISGGEVCRWSFNDGQYRSLCTRPVLRWFPKYTASHADTLLPVSNYVYGEAMETVNGDIKRMKMIYHGFDTRLVNKQQGVKKRRTALTVAEIMDAGLYHKRLLEFVNASKFAPDVSFVLVGPDFDGTGKKLQTQLPKNAEMTGGLYGDDMIKEMSRAAVYVQGSRWESFGCAVAEAMLCECVPVVSRIPVFEEVVGDCGIRLDEPVTPQEIANKVKLALQHPDLGKRARQRVAEKFSIERRKKDLLEAVEDTITE